MLSVFAGYLQPSSFIGPDGPLSQSISSLHEIAVVPVTSDKNGCFPALKYVALRHARNLVGNLG